MLDIQADSFYRVENPGDHHIVSVRGPYNTYETALDSLSDLYRGNPGVEQIVFPVVGKWLIEKADIQCNAIDPVL
jgi:hypothetical protein